MAISAAHCFTILAIVNAAVALKCYSCDSSKGINCNFGFLSLTYNTIDCMKSGDGGFLDTLASAIPKQCVKIVGVDKEDNEFIARGCSVSTGPINSCQAIAKAIQFADQKDLKSLDCFSCDEDKCNSATSLTSFAIFGLLSSCLLFLF